jgi:hypothetical protein
MIVSLPPALLAVTVKVAGGTGLAIVPEITPVAVSKASPAGSPTSIAQLVTAPPELDGFSVAADCTFKVKLVPP